MRERSESAIATLIIVSIVMIVCGVFGMMLGFGSGSMQMLRPSGVTLPSVGMALLGAIAFFGGLIMLTFTMISAVAMSSSEKRGARRVDGRAKVIARFATNKQGDTLVLEDDLNDPNTRFYARIMLTDGTRAEFQCAREVYDQCGEGMTGEAHFQGRWLGAFRPYIGIQPMH